jgi:two-component system NtrC family sensor kinase
MSDQDLLADLQAISVIAETISQSLELDEMLVQVLRKALEITGAEKSGGIFLVDPDERRLQLHAHVNLAGEWAAQGVQTAIEDPICGEVVKSGQIAVTGPFQDTSHSDILGPDHSHILIPLDFQGQVLGVMFLCLGAPRELSEAEHHLLTAIGSQVGAAVGNAQLLAKTGRRASEFEALSRLGRTVGQTQDLEDSLSCVLDDTLETLGVCAGGAYVLDSTALTMRLVVHHGLRHEWCRGWGEVAVGDGLFGGLFKAGTPLLITNLDDAPPALRNAGPGKAMAAVPLRSKGKVLGIFFVLAEEAYKLDPPAFQFLTMLGEQVGVAIENARLLNMLKQQQAKLIRRHRQMIAMNLIAKIVNRSLDLDTIMVEALDTALEVMDMDLGWIRLMGEDGLLHLGPSQGLSPEAVEGFEPLRIGEGIGGEVAETGRPVVVSDVANDPRLASRAVAEAGVQTLLSMPLGSQGRIVGIMSLASVREYHVTQEKLMLALSIGDQIGVAIDKARLFRALEESRKEWETTFSALQDGIAIVGRDFHIVRVNRTLANMFGMEPEDMIGRPCCQVFYGKSLPQQPWCRCRQVLATHKVTSIETDQLKAPGIYDIRLDPLVDSTGELIGVIHSFRNITETRQLRNLMAQNDKLIAIGRLAASVAHEVNNPLFSIGNCLTLLEDASSPNDPNRTFIRLAKSELSRMGQTVERMLDFARPAREPREPVDINYLLTNALLLTEKHMDYSKVTAINDLAPDLTPLFASSNQLTQVFINLILNAIEAMPEGGELHVCSRLIKEDDRDSVELEFTDTGTGIPQEHMERIFEPFFSTKQEVKGVGLGLAISYGIVKSHGGTITVSSQVGKGTTFIIRLPVFSKEEAEAWEEQAEEVSLS